jgi:hypothetical protein
LVFRAPGRKNLGKILVFHHVSTIYDKFAGACMTKSMLDDNSDFYLLNTFPHLWKLHLKLKVCNNLKVVCGHIEAKNIYIF